VCFFLDTVYYVHLSGVSDIWVVVDRLHL
jgi:hypothetical protein